MTWDVLSRCFEKRGIGWVWIRSAESFFHFAICIFCAWALILRVEFVQLQRDTWEVTVGGGKGTEFQSQIAHLVFLSETSSLALAIAFWLCMVRLSFYYSLFSTRFFLLRKAIVRCFTALIPAFSLIFITLLGFAFFAHSVFGATAPQWASIQRSVANLVVMTRKPSLMNMQDMEASDPLLTLGLDFHLVGPLFFIGYTFTVVIVFTAVARSVVIHAYSRATEDDDGSPPNDMVADSPMPDWNPFVYFRKWTRSYGKRMREAHVALVVKISDRGTVAKQRELQREELQRQDEERKERKASAAKVDDKKAAGGRTGLRRKGRSESPRSKPPAKTAPVTSSTGGVAVVSAA